MAMCFRRSLLILNFVHIVAIAQVVGYGPATGGIDLSRQVGGATIQAMNDCYAHTAYQQLQSAMYRSQVAQGVGNPLYINAENVLLANRSQLAHQSDSSLQSQIDDRTTWTKNSDGSRNLSIESVAGGGDGSSILEKMLKGDGNSTVGLYDRPSNFANLASYEMARNTTDRATPEGARSALNSVDVPLNFSGKNVSLGGATQRSSVDMQSLGAYIVKQDFPGRSTFTGANIPLPQQANANDRLEILRKSQNPQVVEFRNQTNSQVQKYLDSALSQSKTINGKDVRGMTVALDVDARAIQYKEDAHGKITAIPSSYQDQGKPQYHELTVIGSVKKDDGHTYYRVADHNHDSSDQRAVMSGSSQVPMRLIRDDQLYNATGAWMMLTKFDSNPWRDLGSSGRNSKQQYLDEGSVHSDSGMRHGGSL